MTRRHFFTLKSKTISVKKYKKSVLKNTKKSVLNILVLKNISVKK